MSDHTLRLDMLTLDTEDAGRIARWWADRLGADVDDSHGPEFVVLTGGGLPTRLAFQQVSDPTPGKNRLHLDLSVTGLGAAVDALVGAGASVVERRVGDGFRWVTMRDPDGNEFCVAESAQVDEL